MQTVWGVYKSFKYEGCEVARLFDSPKKAIEEVLKEYYFQEHFQDPWHCLHIRNETGAIVFDFMQDSSWDYHTRIKQRTESDWFVLFSIIVEEMKVK